jgi:hypothetical protein
LITEPEKKLGFIGRWNENTRGKPSSCRKSQMYSMQHYVMKFVTDLRKVGVFFLVLRFLPPIKLTCICMYETYWKLNVWNTKKKKIDLLAILTKYLIWTTNIKFHYSNQWHMTRAWSLNFSVFFIYLKTPIMLKYYKFFE